MSRNRPGRPARGLAAITWLYVLWSLVPVLIAIRISFNSGKSRSTFQSPSWRWYFTDQLQSVLHDDSLRQPLRNSLKLAALSMLLTVPIGVSMAIGLQRWRGKLSKASNGLMLFPLVTPEIVMGVALFLVFTQVYTGVPRGFTTQLLDRDAKRVHLFHEMYHAEQGYLAATNETIVINIDFASRRSAPWPKQAAERLEAVWAAHQHLPRPAKAGRTMGLRKK